ncbi:uncharacterized protein LOC129789363 [Lutzomyia longipalpis]|uniref:Putative bhlh transcription factor n=1 Tax=Lutzomyia longipalpis TaxID=7200 RepID=A0A1B0CWV1_LUTLO|nr:uncharacterized protein LOC129789363 [Lutzomyia longipalpis]
MSIVGNKSDEFVMMEALQKSDEKFIIKQEDGGGGELHNTSTMIDNDKKMRRQIANSNERRRMQSINAGFQSLRLLLPHHEGEKLSKAAILQQTAEFVYNLEQDKSRLMSNVSYLRELLLKNNINPDLPTVTGSTVSTTTATTSTVSGKKRKLDTVMTMQTISDSSDEGLGSMSPEPLTFVTVMTKPSGPITTTTSSTTATTNSILAKEVVELKHQLEIERRQRVLLEDQLRQVECQVYPDQVSREEHIYQHQEVIEHTNNLRVDGMDMVDDIEDGVEVIEEEDEDNSTSMSIIPEDPITKLSLSQLSELQQSQDMHVLSLESLQPTGQNVVVCSSPVHEISIEETHGLSPSRVVVECNKSDVEKVEISTKQRLQPILEAVIKAEPKVEVERITNSPVSLTVVKTEQSTQASSPQSRMYLTSTSRQNLETIVEAIRHLEGDHLFGETTQEQPTQEAPLALTTHNKQTHLHPHQYTRKIHVDVNPFLHFRTSTSATTQHLQQCRPGVIVVKQNS